MPLARVLWLALVVFVIVLWSLGTAALIGEPLPDCAEVTCDPVDFNAGDLALAQELDLPSGILGGFFPALTVALPGALFFVIAGVVYWRRSDDWMGLLVSFTLVYIGGLLFTSSNDALARAYPALDPAVGLVSLLGVTSFGLLFYLFPDGRFVPQWTRWSFGILVLIVLVAEVIPLPEKVTEVVASSGLAGLGGTGIFAQIYRYTRVSGPLERQQTKWVLVGFLGAIGLMITWMIVSVVFPPDEPSSGRVYALLVTGPVVLVLVFVLPICFAISILRYRLWDIDLVINRALVYGALTATLAGTYVGIVLGLQSAFRAVTDQGGGIAIVISTLVIAALFQPLRRRAQTIIDRRLFRQKYDAAQTLGSFGERIRDEVDIERVSEAFVNVVEETMQPAHVSLWLRQAPRSASPESSEYQRSQNATQS